MLDSNNSKLIYLYLATVEEATINDLQSTLEMQQLALFSTLDTLEGEGFIERDGETFTITARRVVYGWIDQYNVTHSQFSLKSGVR